MQTYTSTLADVRTAAFTTSSHVVCGSHESTAVNAAPMHVGTLTTVGVGFVFLSLSVRPRRVSSALVGTWVGELTVTYAEDLEPNLSQRLHAI